LDRCFYFRLFSRAFRAASGEGLLRASCPPPLRGRRRCAPAFKFAPGEFVTRAIPGARPAGALRASKSAILPICQTPAGGVRVRCPTGDRLRLA
jgi:hypothetical protein